MPAAALSGSIHTPGAYHLKSLNTYSRLFCWPSIPEEDAAAPTASPDPGTAGQRHYPELGTRSPLVVV
jgi:hypothetical protein